MDKEKRTFYYWMPDDSVIPCVIVRDGRKRVLVEFDPNPTYKKGVYWVSPKNLTDIEHEPYRIGKTSMYHED